MTVREYCRLLKERGGFSSCFAQVNGVLYPFNQAIKRSEYITGTRDADADVNDIDELIQFHDEVQVQHFLEPILYAQVTEQRDSQGETRYALQAVLSAENGELGCIPGVSFKRTGSCEGSDIYAVPEDGKIRVTEKRYRLTPPGP